MSPNECPREAQVLEALQTSAWPECCAADLRAHVDTCGSCADLVAVVLALIDEHRAAAARAPVPSSGMVWWRAQTRARQEAAAAAMRPITVVQGLSLAVAAGLLAAAASFVSPAFRQWVAWAAGALSVLRGGEGRGVEWPATLALATPLGAAVVLALTMMAVLTPLALYLARSDK
jgi:hypothetical protein